MRVYAVFILFRQNSTVRCGVWCVAWMCVTLRDAYVQMAYIAVTTQHQNISNSIEIRCISEKRIQRSNNSPFWLNNFERMLLTPFPLSKESSTLMKKQDQTDFIVQNSMCFIFFSCSMFKFCVSLLSPFKAVEHFYRFPFY